MTIAPISPSWPQPQPAKPAAALQTATPRELASEEFRQTFDAFVGQTFFHTMLSSMRKTVGKPAYFHGGRAEEVFQGQLDQLLTERISEAAAEQFSAPMLDLLIAQGRP